MARNGETAAVVAGTPSAASNPQPSRTQRFFSTTERRAGLVFVLPAVLALLFLSIFPLLVSLYLSFSRLKFSKEGLEINWVGLANYRKLLAGSEKTHFLGKLGQPSWAGWLLFAVGAGLLLFWIVRYARGSSFSIMGLFWRVIAAAILALFLWLAVHTTGSDGRPGTLVVTWIYVFVGIAVQYLLGLGLALLCTQPLRGRRFFRVVFLLPMMITPVGIAYTFRMLSDTDKGPFQPIWQALGLGLYSWVTNPWGARIAVMIGDIWQWTPFMFIVLLAALEGQSVEMREAALVDGANRLQIFWYITMPQIVPVSLTVILIRMIEAFKIVDLPNVLTNGGPGTATESMTLHAWISWRTLDVGGSSAIAFLLLIVVTFMAMVFVNFARRSSVESSQV